MVVLGDDDRLMLFRLTPVIGIIGMLASRVGESQGNRGALVFQQVALDTGKKGVLLRVNTCGDLDHLAISPER